jgi:hypothetical protein
MLMRLRFGVWLLIVAVAAGCEREATPSQVSAPGRDETTKTQALEAGAALLQRKPPLRQLDAYLNGFHFYSGDMQGQIEAHHYCGHLNEDVIQCVIFDGEGADAKLMGVEYIISGAQFATLPTAEKRLWHSHVHEVRSGQLIAPGIPAAAEHELMEKIVSTYGKTWHTWHTDKERALPLGAPALMMGFTADGQVRQALVEGRDRRYDVSSSDKRKQRADIPVPPIDPEADAWQKGVVVQLEAKQR